MKKFFAFLFLTSIFSFQLWSSADDSGSGRTSGACFLVSGGENTEKALELYSSCRAEDGVVKGAFKFKDGANWLSFEVNSAAKFRDLNCKLQKVFPGNVKAFISVRFVVI